MTIYRPDLGSLNIAHQTAARLLDEVSGWFVGDLDPVTRRELSDAIRDLSAAHRNLRDAYRSARRAVDAPRRDNIGPEYLDHMEAEQIRDEARQERRDEHAADAADWARDEGPELL